MRRDKTWITVIFFLVCSTFSPAHAGESLSEEQALSLLSRVAIVTNDLERSRTFYGEILGFEEIFADYTSNPVVNEQMNLPPEAKIYFSIYKKPRGFIGETDLDGAMVGLLQVENVELPTMIRPDDTPMVIGESMLAIRTRDIWAVDKKLKALGVRYLLEPMINNDGAHIELVVHDPNGIRVHIVQREGP